MKFRPVHFVLLCLAPATGWAGIYSQGLNDAGNTYDAPIPGYVGSDGDGVVSGNNQLNPIFVNWADTVVTYQPATGVSAGYAHSEYTTGPATGDNFDVASLGDLSALQIANSTPPGYITLGFDVAIRNGSGADFAVFENGHLAQSSGPGGIVAGQIFGELAYVEVSTDGINFSRFPSISQTPAAVGAFGTIDPTNVLNLAGKHVNSFDESWGTPFNLDDLLGDSKVLGGLVDLSNINYIRIVDIPGNGSSLDSLGNPIYDAWQTTGSGGFDLEAIGVIHQVPEPSTWMLLGATGLWFAIFSRRRLRTVRAT